MRGGTVFNAKNFRDFEKLNTASTPSEGGTKAQPADGGHAGGRRKFTAPRPGEEGGTAKPYPLLRPLTCQENLIFTGGEQVQGKQFPCYHCEFKCLSGVEKP